MEFTLTNNQQQIFEAIEASSENFLICGKPGVGKSVLINHLVEHGNKPYTLAAPTGLAALNIGGRTLHSIFGLPVSQGIFESTFNRFSEQDRVVNNIKFNMRHLIIDEISMVRADVFDFIDRMMRKVKGIDKPFGGVQVIAVGDFFQLPPIVDTREMRQMKEEGYTSPFVFSSKVFKGNFRKMELSEVLRQKGDPLFIDLLDGARTGQLRVKHLQALNEQVKAPDDLRIRLTSRNAEADDINSRFLATIPEKTFSFTADKFGEWPALPADPELKLKLGAQVMVKMNAADRPPGLRGEFQSKVVNGTLGKVHDFIVEDLEIKAVEIELETGETATIYRKRWERKVKEKLEDGTWSEKIVASYEQIPLALAWAISMHKSQGQSFDKVHVDAGRVFAPGQLYVALSRCRSLAGLSLESEVKANKCWADKSVLNFFNNNQDN